MCHYKVVLKDNHHNFQNVFPPESQHLVNEHCVIWPTSHTSSVLQTEGVSIHVLQAKR